MAKQRAAKSSGTDQPATERLSTEDRIRRAAVEQFALRGFHGVGIRDLAQEAGISLASLYHYMGTKEDLLFRIMIDSIRGLNDAAARVTDGLETAQSKVAALSYMHVVTHALRSQETGVFDTEIRALTGEMHDQVVTLRDDYERVWADAVADGVDAGVFDVSDVRLARLGILQMCSSVSRWFRADGARSASEVGRSYVRMVLALLEYDGEPSDVLSLADCERYDAIVADVWHLHA